MIFLHIRQVFLIEVVADLHSVVFNGRFTAHKFDSLPPEKVKVATSSADESGGVEVPASTACRQQKSAHRN